MTRRLLASLLLLHLGCGANVDLAPATGAAGGEDAGTAHEDGGGAQEDAGVAVSVTSLALGWDHSCVLLSDGSAACWGRNFGGQLGGGTATMIEPIPRPLPDAHDLRSLAGGYVHGCAVQNDGTLACWGDDSLGAVGTGTKAKKLPWMVIGSGFSVVSVGFDISCAVRTDGSAACWGNGGHGELGNGVSSSIEPTPTPVKDLAGATSIAASDWVTCALLVDGGVKCWGLGPLGDGTASESAVPVSVAGLPGPARRVAVGAEHACALLEGGKVMCWGHGGYGGLGVGPDTPWAEVPVAVPLAAPAIALSACQQHTCAVLDDGTAWCWGDMTIGSEGSYVPAPVPAVTSAVTIASGSEHDCVLLAGGEVQCWGANNGGQLGDGTTTSSDTPITVIGPW